MRRAAHFALVMLGNAALLFAYAALLMASIPYLLADRAWPGADRGNCWSFAIAQAWREGGYLRWRMVRHVPLPLPHLAWLSHAGAQPLQTEPHYRHKGWRVLFVWMYFRFWIKAEDSQPSPAWHESVNGKI